VVIKGSSHSVHPAAAVYSPDMAPETCVNAFDALAEPTVPAWASALQAAARCLPVVMAVSACGLLGWCLAGRGEPWPQLRVTSPPMLVVCVLATLGATLAPGPIFWVMTRRVEKQLGLAESTWLAVLTMAIGGSVSGVWGPPPSAQAALPEARESLIGPETVSDVPLTGLSFVCREELQCDEVWFGEEAAALALRDRRGGARRAVAIAAVDESRTLPRQ
jgi:hypothetical protein